MLKSIVVLEKNIAGLACKEWRYILFKWNDFLAIEGDKYYADPKKYLTKMDCFFARIALIIFLCIVLIVWIFYLPEVAV